jgi:hypothetical protein
LDVHPSAGHFMSEVLVEGFPDGEGEVVMIAPDKPVPNGAVVLARRFEVRRSKPAGLATRLGCRSGIVLRFTYG